MFIAIRKEPNGSLYMDKEICSRTQEVQDEQGNITIQPLFSDETLSKPPYNYTKVELEDKYSDCQASDFNDDLTFSIEKYTARKQEEDKFKYKREVERLIALRYDVRDELAIQRQKNEKPEEYKEYYDYVELCKQEAKNAINQEQITESISEECEDGNESGQEQTTSVSDCLLSKEEIQMIINDESL